MNTTGTMAQQLLDELTAIYDNAPIGLAVIDVSGKFLRINRLLANINGVSVEHHIGRTIREIVPDLTDQAEAIISKIVRTGQPTFKAELIGGTQSVPIRRSWTERWSPLRDKDGAICPSSDN